MMDHGLALLCVEAIEQGVVNRDLGRHPPRVRRFTDKRRPDAGDGRLRSAPEAVRNPE